MRAERYGVEFPTETRDFLLPNTVQSEPESPQTPIELVSRLLPWDKVDGA